MVVVDNILQTIGGTPHVRINHLFGMTHKVYIKLERANPGGSIKDRTALWLIGDAERRGMLKPGFEVIEPTSGNTGIGLALVCAVKKYPLTLVMPESMSIERRRIMVAYGARLVLTPPDKGMSGAIAKANQLAAGRNDVFVPQQFENPANIQAHVETTAQELAYDFPNGIDFLFAGVGTGGHVTGCAKVLKQRFPDLKVLAVEPAASPVLSGGRPGHHPIQGIGAGFIPANCHRELLDGIVHVTTDEAFAYTMLSAREEGIFVGISTGASLAAIAKKLADIPAGATIIGFCYDSGERYLSTEGLFNPHRSIVHHLLHPYFPHPCPPPAVSSHQPPQPLQPPPAASGRPSPADAHGQQYVSGPASASASWFHPNPNPNSSQPQRDTTMPNPSTSS